MKDGKGGDVTGLRNAAIGAALISVVACGSSGGSISQGSSTKSGNSSTSGSKSPGQSASSAAPDALQVVATGFGQDSGGGFGIPVVVAVVKNPSSSRAAANITAQFTAYGAGTTVLGTTSTSAALIRAGASQTFADNLAIPQGAKIDHVVAQVAASAFQDDPHPDAVIVGQGAQYVPDQYSPKVNAQLVSHYTSDLKQIYAAAVCYGAGNAIVGGGFTFVDLLPGKGTTGASISATVSSPPTSCEVSATLSNLSTITP